MWIMLSSSIYQDKPTVTVKYDTTFNLGHFYVSVLLLRETEFDPSPIVPLAFWLHERKLQSTHDKFFSHICKLCPQLDNAVNVVIYTRQDKTMSFTDAGASTSMSVSLISIHYTVTCFRFRLTQLCNHTTNPDFARICPNVL